MSHYKILRSILNLFILILLLVTCQSNGSNDNKDYITILSDKLELLSQNEKLQLNLMDYVDQLQERIDVVKKLSKLLRAPFQSSKGRESEFLSNPLNSFSLLRHMESDWIHVLKLLEQPIGQEQIEYLREMQSKRPQLQHVRDSMAAIHRIKETYKLKAWDMANGLLKGVQYNAKLSVLDCYEMGYLYYNVSQFKRAEEWLLTSRHLMDQSQTDLHQVLGVTRSDISSLLTRSLVAMDKFPHARTVLMDEPQFRDAAEEWLDYFKANIPEKVENEQFKELNDEYCRLCSSNYKANSSRLLCSYKRTSNPFLILAPFKMEQLSLDPPVVVFHDVVYSSEIARLESATKSLLERAGVRSLTTNKQIVSNARTVSAVWLPHFRLSDQDNRLVSRIQQRIKDITELRLDRGMHEFMQLLNYGYGGHYAWHYDFANITSSNYFSDDRIATALVYLNDVSSGGATIFPRLNLTVKPERGKMLYWYNVRLYSYDYEERSLHGACPVIIGNKLAMVQWIHEGDQMFDKPCREPPKHRKNVYF